MIKLELGQKANLDRDKLFEILKEEYVDRRLVRAAFAFGVLLILASASGCTAARAFLSKPRSKSELLRRMDAKYKNIESLSYRSRHVVTHTGAVIKSQVWEDPPFSMEVSKDRVTLGSEDISFLRLTQTVHGRKVINSVAVWSDRRSDSSEGHSISLLSFVGSAAPQKHLVYQGIKRKGLSFVYALKGKPEEEGGVKEILIDPETLLPVKIISEGEDLKDEIQNLSDYQINSTIPKSRFRIGFPPKTMKLVSRFASLNRLPNLSVKEEAIGDFPFDLYWPSHVPQGYRLVEVQAVRVKTSGTVGHYTYELPSISFTFQNEKTGEDIALGVEISSDEKAFKAGLLSDAGEDVDLNSSMPEMFASISRWETPKEASLRSGKIFYWLSEGKVSKAIIKVDKNWLKVSPIYGEDLEEQFLLTLVDSLTK